MKIVSYPSTDGKDSNMESKENMEYFKTLSNDEQQNLIKEFKHKEYSKKIKEYKTTFDSGVDKVMEKIQQVVKKSFPDFHEYVNIPKITLKTGKRGASGGPRRPSRNLRVVVNGKITRPNTLLRMFLPKGHTKNPEGVVKYLKDNTDIEKIVLVEEKAWKTANYKELQKSDIQKDIDIFQKTERFSTNNRPKKS